MSSHHCPDDLVNQLFSSHWNTTNQPDLECHLAECNICRQKLEDASGSRMLWDQLTKAADDQWDSQWTDSFSCPSLNDALSEFSESLQSSPVASSAPSHFARNHNLKIVQSLIPHFGPSDDPGSVGRIGNYEIIGMIGSGGMGVVLKAREKSLERIVAIKALLPHLMEVDSCRQRFQREAKAAAALNHPGIVPIYRVDQFNGMPYFVMPYEIGPSLQQRIESEGPLSIQESLRVTSQIAAALSVAHQSGLVHRDIKPSNILLAPGTERALLTDFGLAQATEEVSLTQTGILSGTPPFMSPEQARGESIDHRSDLFSLGSLLFTMLTGKPPINEVNVYKLVRQIGDQSMPPLKGTKESFPDWLQNLVSLLHQRNPEQRVQTASECLDLTNKCLSALDSDRPEAFPKDLISPKSNATNFQQIRRVGLILTAAVCVAFFFTAIPSFWDWRPFNDKSSGSSVPQVPDSEATGSSNEQSSNLLEWNDGLDPLVNELNHEIQIFENNLLEEHNKSKENQ